MVRLHRYRSLFRLVALALATALPAHAAPQGPQILTEDVTRFYQVYDAAGGRPTIEQLDRDYLGPGTEGLHQFAQLRRVSGAAIVDTLQKRPEVYAGARRCMAVLPEVKQRLTDAFVRLAAIYPEAKFPPVTIVVGRGKPIGITSPSGVTMGLEALCAADVLGPNLADRFVHTITHEYGHIQQPPDIQALEPGAPGLTVLKMSLIEGAAEFTAELISGDIGDAHLRAWTRGHEAEIDAAFIRDEDTTDFSAWLDNGIGTADHPGELGYWVGYRIVKSYYDHAPDKHQALRNIYEMRDAKGFLAKSGWTAGGS